MKVWKWLGENEFVPGCPARDVTQEEAEKEGILDLIETSELYELQVTEDEQEEEIDNGS